MWHTVGPRDLAECRGADKVWQQQRYKLSYTSARQFGIKCSVHRYIKSGVYRRSVNIATVLLLFATVYTLTSALV